MVRLVFRPYTQIWRSICTSESLRSSIRVSPDFDLFTHSSPSFGSQHLCSHSNLSSKNHGRPMMPPSKKSGFSPITFIAHSGFATRILAYTLDSLVRVSRRDNESHFISISTILQGNPVVPALEATACCDLSLLQQPKSLSNIWFFLNLAHDFFSQAKFMLIYTCLQWPSISQSTDRTNTRTTDFHRFLANHFRYLFNSLFKVLFTFPSQYLFAIGQPPIFSVRWSLPPI